MAQLLAPYNNSMRLGQGFNSYTQQVCLDRAVLPDWTAERRRVPKETINLSSSSKALSNGSPAESSAQESAVQPPRTREIEDGSMTPQPTDTDSPAVKTEDFISDRDIHSRAVLSNDLEDLNQTFRPSMIAVWTKDDRLNGIMMTYANGQKKSHGACDGTASHTLKLAHDGSEVIVEVLIRETTNEMGISYIASIGIATSACNSIDTAPVEVPRMDIPKDVKQPGAKPGEAAQETESEQPTDAETPDNETLADEARSEAREEPKAGGAPGPAVSAGAKSQKPEIKTTRWSKPDDMRYSLRGFFSFAHLSTISTLGVVWGKDSFVPVPNARIQPSICRTLLDQSEELQANIHGHLDFASKFFLGSSIAVKAPKSSKIFNALDAIDVSWQIKTIAFACDHGKLSGLKVAYTNGREFAYGAYTKESEMWTCDVLSNLTIVKMTAGKMTDEESPWIDTMEFVRGDERGHMPDWPLELSTLRFLGDGEVRVSKDVHEFVETAPKNGVSKWSIRGFYGEHDGVIITRLGVIWGRG